MHFSSTEWTCDNLLYVVILMLFKQHFIEASKKKNSLVLITPLYSKFPRMKVQMNFSLNKQLLFWKLNIGLIGKFGNKIVK